MAIVLKTPAEIERMRRSGALLRQVHQIVESVVKPGATTMDLERVAEAKIRELGARPAFKGYQNYPACLCTSVNEEVIHGIPSDRRVLKEGDVVSVDCGLLLDGYYSDAAVTYPVGTLDPQARKLLDVTKASLEQAIRQAQGISAQRCRKCAKPKGMVWSGSLSAMALAAACMRIRRCRTMAGAARGRS